MNWKAFYNCGYYYRSFMIICFTGFIFQEKKSFHKYGLEVRNYFQVFHAHKYVDIYSMLYVTIAKTQFYVLKL